jgi:hypothetical protein
MELQQLLVGPVGMHDRTERLRLPFVTHDTYIYLPSRSDHGPTIRTLSRTDNTKRGHAVIFIAIFITKVDTLCAVRQCSAVESR